MAITDDVALQHKRIRDRVFPLELIANDVSGVVAAREFRGLSLVTRVIERWMDEVIFRERQFRVIIDPDLGRLQKTLTPSALIAEFEPHDAEQPELVKHREGIANLSLRISRGSVSQFGDIGVGHL